MRESEQLPVTFFWLLLSFTLITTCWLLLAAAGGERCLSSHLTPLLLFGCCIKSKWKRKKKKKKNFRFAPSARHDEPRFPLFWKTLWILTPVYLLYLDAFYADQSEYEHNSWPAQLVLLLSLSRRSPCDSTQTEHQSSSRSWAVQHGEIDVPPSLFGLERLRQRRERERIIISKASE